MTIAYRRDLADMGASDHEKDIARGDGVLIRTRLAPRRVIGEDGRVTAVEFERTAVEAGRATGTGVLVTLPCDQVLLAIGQIPAPGILGEDDLTLTRGRIVVDAEGRTSNPKVWAGGDCTDRGRDLTVEAVAAGRDAARSIDRALRAAC